MKRKLAGLESLLIFMSLIFSFYTSPSPVLAENFEGIDLQEETPVLEEEAPLLEEGTALEEGDLDLGEDLVGPALRGPGDRQEIHITSKEELLNLLNTSYHMSIYTPGDEWRYGVKNADIYLEGDFTISSDEVNAQIPHNTLYEDYTFSFNLTNSNFYGGGHTITIEEGNRDMYPLFGQIWNTEENTTYQVNNLNLVYKGNVRGAGFAHKVNASNLTSDYDLSEINVEVNGDVLPLLQAQWFDQETDGSGQTTKYYGTHAWAAGFVIDLVLTEVSDVKVHVTGNIGSASLEKAPGADMDLVYARSGGFLVYQSLRHVNKNQFRDIQGVNITVDGSILATSKHTRAEATGLGYDIQFKKFKDVTLKVGGDIKATTDGDYNLHKYQGYGYVPLIAAGAGQDLHYLEDVSLDISGSIIAENKGNIHFDTLALGIGQWDYINDLEDDADLQALPLTIKNVRLNVGGDISATSSKAYDAYLQFGAEKPSPKTMAVLGFANWMSSGLDNYDVFENNSLAVKGHVKAKSQEAYSFALLWGYFMGDNNQLSAQSLQASNEKGLAYTMPFRHFLKGQNNTITLEEDMVGQGKDGYMAGLAQYVTQFDGEKDGNTINIKGFQAEGISVFAGFANYAKKHTNQPDVEVDVKNVTLNLDDVVIQSPAEDALIGGFISMNYGKISKAHVYGKDLTVKNSQKGKTGGFVGYNKGDITDSDVQFKTISVLGDPATQRANHLNLGGFEGYNYGGTISNSTALIVDDLTTENGNYVNLGGFTGIGYDSSYLNNAAQVNGSLTSTNNLGVNNLGGFAGKLLAYGKATTVDKSAALVFGDLKGATDKTDGKTPSLAGGFAGVLQGKEGAAADNYIKNSGAYVGGDISLAGADGMVGAGEAVGLIYYGTLEGFSLLAKLDDNQSSDKALKSYLAGGQEPLLKNNYLVEVDQEKRRAFPISLEGGDFTKGDSLGQISIAGRKLQSSYWGDEADPSQGTYKDFDYVKENKDNLVLTPIATGSSQISQAPFKRAILPDFGTRHLALYKEGGPIYDILGIPAGPYQEPEEPEDPGDTSPSPGKPLPLNRKDHYQYLIGYKDQTFRPKNPMTREEVALMFSRLLEDRPQKGQVYPYNFSDVARNRWSITALSYMSQKKIIEGYPDGTFRPENRITRAEFAAMATRFADLKEGDKSFRDVGRGHWAYAYIQKAAQAGWIKGYPDGTFKPDQAISRAEVVTLVNRMLNRLADESFVDQVAHQVYPFVDIQGTWAYYPIVEATNGHDYTRTRTSQEETWKNLNDKSFAYDK
ncbi:MAG: S-layer homology domain-containing protein [Tissierellia bacterium]|nr:S-layer homology domain-containing protein [Tissierellia bacterium]